MQSLFASQRSLSPRATALVIAAVVLASAPVFAGEAAAQVLGYAPSQTGVFPPGSAAGVPADQGSALPDRLRRAEIRLESREPPGTVIIDTGNTVLYYILGQGRAIRYGVGVGREGFTWSGAQTISRKAEWPDWQPPAQMIARQPYLPRFMAGGPGNPLGARAMYLGSSEYRIHGTNDPTTIGKFVSSGCIRMTNEDVIDLFSRVDVGTRVLVLPKTAPLQARATVLGATPAARRSVGTMPSGRQAMSVSISGIN